MKPDPLTIWRRLGGGEPPPALGRDKGALLIMGGAACVWADYARLRPWRGEIMAINDIGQFLPEIVRHWATLHPEYAAGWKQYRAGHCLGEGLPVAMHAPRHRPGVTQVWELGNLGETSGLFACFVGLMLGYDDITLAGVPADNSGHFFDPPWRQASGTDPRMSFQVWSWARDEIFCGRVRSLSGNTAAWLGEPA